MASELTTNPPQTVTVTYAPASESSGPTIEIAFSGDPKVPYNSQTTFNLVPGSSNFDFTAISFWGKDNLGNKTNVARTFEKFKNGVARFNGYPYVQQVDAQSKSSMSFTVVNDNETQGGALSFQVTITADGQTLFTSMDPQIELDPD